MAGFNNDLVFGEGLDVGTTPNTGSADNSTEFSRSGSNVVAIVNNTSNTANSGASHSCRVEGTSSGDPFHRCAVGASDSFSSGIDAANDSSIFLIGYQPNGGSAPSTATQLVQTHSTGSIRKPLNPCVFAKIGSAVANFTGNGTQAVVIFDTELFDQQNNYNPATGVFTAPITGRYLIIAQVTFTNLTAAHTSYLLEIRDNNPGNRLNSVGNPGVMRNINDELTITQQAIMQMNASSVMDVEVVVSGSTQTVGLQGENFGSFSFLSIDLIS